MWWGRRRPIPLWVWILAMIGFRSLLARKAMRGDPEWRGKRRRFREKMKEAFSVWQEPAEEGVQDATAGASEDGSTPS